MARVDLHGKVTQFGGAGMTVPWGIAVDGDDNIWVANFFGERLSHLCGARVETCPTGHVGDEISPTQTGYFFNRLQRNTGVQIDASGNVWLANNWKTVPTPRQPVRRRACRLPRCGGTDRHAVGGHPEVGDLAQWVNSPRTPCSVSA
jgi:sugar lactone lactonase YvrE